MPKLLDFKAKAGAPLRIVNKSATKAEIVIYGGIGPDYWGDGSMISAKQFLSDFRKIDSTVTEITVRINSGGGDVFDGIAIYNLLSQSKAKIIVMIDGLAASIASIIALAGDDVVIGEGALFMVHLPWTWAAGNRMELDNTVNRLIDIEEQMVSIYAKKTGMSRPEVKALLEAETWMGADEALELGFVDSKSEEEAEPIAASVMESRWFNKKPKTFKSQASAVDAAKLELKKKIEACVAKK